MQMWRSDGVPAKHPTLALTLLSVKMRMLLQKAGTYVVNTEGIDIDTTCEDLKTAAPGDDLSKQVKELLARAHTYTSNVPGTKSYWESQFHSFRATSVHRSHIEKDAPAFFHTGSIAEYHDYGLRMLLQKYVNCLSNPNPLLDGNKIQNDDKVFALAVQTYKQVVTHYLAAKMEIWMTKFMASVYGVTGGNIAIEFAKSRGAIHYHSVLYSRHRAMSQCSDALLACATTISIAMKQVNDWTENSYTPRTHSEIFHRCPSSDFTPAGVAARERFCKRITDGTVTW